MTRAGAVRGALAVRAEAAEPLDPASRGGWPNEWYDSDKATRTRRLGQGDSGPKERGGGVRRTVRPRPQPPPTNTHPSARSTERSPAALTPPGEPKRRRGCRPGLTGLDAGAGGPLGAPPPACGRPAGRPLLPCKASIPAPVTRSPTSVTRTTSPSSPLLPAQARWRR